MAFKHFGIECISALNLISTFPTRHNFESKLDIYVFITNYLRQIQIRVYLNISSNELYSKKQIRDQLPFN
jgi:hypothetical protein